MAKKSAMDNSSKVGASGEKPQAKAPVSKSSKKEKASNPGKKEK